RRLAGPNAGWASPTAPTANATPPPGPAAPAPAHSWGVRGGPGGGWTARAWSAARLHAGSSSRASSSSLTGDRGERLRAPDRVPDRRAATRPRGLPAPPAGALRPWRPGPRSDRSRAGWRAGVTPPPPRPRERAAGPAAVLRFALRRTSRSS